MKTCSKCMIEKPFEAFFKNKDRKDGHTSDCKECIKLRYSELKKNQLMQLEKQVRSSIILENKILLREGKKLCATCKEAFLIEDLVRGCYCEECSIKKDKERYEKDKEKIKEKTKEYYEKNKEINKEKRREYFKKYNQNNKEYHKEYHEKNKEKRNKQSKEYSKEYREKNKEIIKERNRQYYLKKKLERLQNENL